MMAQFEHKEENSKRSSLIDNLCSYFGNSHLVNNLISQTPTMETRKSSSDTKDPGESTDSMSRPEDHSPSMDMSSALRSVALHKWGLNKIRSSVLTVFSENSSVSPLDEENGSHKKKADPAEEETLSAPFQSKYIDIFPLYQDYSLQAVREDLHRLKGSFVSELVTPQYLLAVQSRLSPSSRSASSSPQQSLRSPDGTLSSPPPQPIRVTPCTLWQDLEEVKVSGLLNSLTRKEIKLQESMFELIGSEASYLRSLRVAVNHFYASKALKQTLSPMEHHILFSNIRHVMAASERFLMDLEVRLGESVFMSQVGDIVLQHCPEFHSLYVPYVTNMMYQEALIKQQLQQNREFLHTLKKLESDSLCQRQTLKSFLVLPFQRITRVKLLLESILKQTEPDTEVISNLEKPIKALHEIVTDCDKGVQKMKQIEELVCLEMLLDFNKIKSVPLVISQRFLVHQGPLKRLTLESTNTSRPSFISIYLHLFNDLLIISSKRNQRYIVEDHTKFPACVTTEHLKAEVLGLPPLSFLVHLTRSQTGHPTVMILVALTRSDKEAWIKALSSKP
ncbi:rho guanine nucleotide exchange factor 19 [Parambassis ranga]|uniref:Rho guanine nucleotide exchange factor 19 n=1 Tax=Parambassis ranga TaxID=210632 RepID=A0A6P7IGP5_9TELE|nr:rho guanine nucleotide exchange factor 19-like [Parambassis ranga]